MHDHEHDRGLEYDLDTLRSRRKILGLFGGVSLAVLAGCASTDTTTPTTSTSTSAASGAVAEIPEETAGPFPGDGSNGPNVLTESGIVRSDIRSSFGSASGVAEGVPLTLELTVVEADTGEPLAGAAVYLWHCDRNGDYSMYSQAAANENYLRGVQEADTAGLVTFTSIFPAAYSGRWPHIHFEVYPSLAERPARAASSPPPSWRCPRTSARPSTPPTATPRASAISRRPPWTPTTSSATGGTPSSPPSRAACRPATWPPCPCPSRRDTPTCWTNRPVVD